MPDVKGIVKDVAESAKKPFKSRETGVKILGAAIGAVIVLGISEFFKDRPSYTGQIPFVGPALVPAVVPAESTEEGGAF